MSREAIALSVAGVVVLVAVAVIGLGAIGTTVSTSSEGGWAPFPFPPGDGSAGVVADVREESGQSLFGIKLTADDYYVQVMMAVPEACVLTDPQGREQLSIAGECADLPARGEVIGGGTSSEGARLVTVQFEVERGCFEALYIGDTWPSDKPMCERDLP